MLHFEIVEQFQHKPATCRHKSTVGNYIKCQCQTYVDVHDCSYCYLKVGYLRYFSKCVVKLDRVSYSKSSWSRNIPQHKEPSHGAIERSPPQMGKRRAILSSFLLIVRRKPHHALSLHRIIFISPSSSSCDVYSRISLSELLLHSSSNLIFSIHQSAPDEPPMYRHRPCPALRKYMRQSRVLGTILRSSFQNLPCQDCLHLEHVDHRRGSEQKYDSFRYARRRRPSASLVECCA